MELYSIACVAIGMGEAASPVKETTIAKAILAWLRVSPTALSDFKHLPLEMLSSSPDFRGQRIYHPAAPGRWYCGENRLQGPDHHSRADWEEAIAQALILFEQERVSARPRRQYQSRPRSRKNWHLSDYPGKHGPEPASNG